MNSRSVAIVGFHLIAAAVFLTVAVWSLLSGDLVGGVMQSVIAVLFVVLGIGLARSA